MATIQFIHQAIYSKNGFQPQINLEHQPRTQRWLSVDAGAQWKGPYDWVIKDLFSPRHYLESIHKASNLILFSGEYMFCCRFGGWSRKKKNDTGSVANKLLFCFSLLATPAVTLPRHYYYCNFRCLCCVLTKRNWWRHVTTLAVMLRHIRFSRGPPSGTKGRIHFRLRPDEWPVGQRGAAAILKRAAVHGNGCSTGGTRLPATTTTIQTTRWVILQGHWEFVCGCNINGFAPEWDAGT